MTSGAADIFCHIEKLINKLYVIYMLTKSDLQAIDKLITGRIREEVEAEGRNIRDELKGDIQESRIRIQQEIRDLSDRIKNIEIRINNFEKDSRKEFQKLNKRFTETCSSIISPIRLYNQNIPEKPICQYGMLK